MKRIYRLAKPISLVLAIYVFMISGPQQAALAALVGTDTVLDAAEVQSARDRIRSLMAREDIQAALSNQGIDPQEARPAPKLWRMPKRCAWPMRSRACRPAEPARWASSSAPS